MEKVNATDCYGNIKRISLPKPSWEGKEEISTGIFLEAIYLSSQNKRMVVQQYSIWQKRQDGDRVGTQYLLIEDIQEMMFYSKFGKIAEELEELEIVKAEEL